MASNGMSRERVEFLFESYLLLLELLKALKAELATVLWQAPANPDDTIYALAVERKPMDGAPRPPRGNIGNPTIRVAETYRRKVRTESVNPRREIAEDIIELTLVLDKIEVALSVLTERQRAILRARYWERKTWNQIADKLRLGISLCKQERQAALLTMERLLRIDTGLYMRVTGKLPATSSQ